MPPGHWLLIEDSAPFRAELRSRNESAATIHAQSIAVGNRHIACFAPRASAAETELKSAGGRVLLRGTLPGTEVVVVDDVVTTGATARESVRVLQAAERHLGLARMIA